MHGYCRLLDLSFLCLEEREKEWLATFPFPCLFIASLCWTSCRPVFAYFMCASFATVFGPLWLTGGYF